jgi:glycosyltransferase involved in cell wall biosynthesis
MHILILTSWYIDEHGGNPSVFIEDQVALLKKYGFEVSIIHPELNGTFLQSLFNKDIVLHTIDDGVSTLRLRIKPRLPFIRKFNYKLLLNQVNKAIKKHNLAISKIDLIHSHVFFSGGLIAGELAQIHQKPWVHQEHFSGFVDGSGRISRSEFRMFRKAIMRVDKFLAVSSFVDNAIKKEVPNLNQSCVFPIPIQHCFHYKPPPTGPFFRFLFIGQPSELKGGALLLNAWDKFSKKNPDTTLTILGGKMHENYEHNLNEISSQQINWIDWSNREETARIIQEHHVIISTSKIETFGMALAEAIACGRPVITTESGGVADFVNTLNSVRINSTIPELVEAMIQIRNNYHSFQFEKMSEVILEKYGFDNVGQKLTEFYQQFCKTENTKH